MTLLNSIEALEVLLQGRPISEESGKYLYTCDGSYVYLYHRADKRCFLATRVPIDNYKLYDGISYYETDYSFRSEI